MKKIAEFKISLMKRESDYDKETGKCNYSVKLSGTLHVKKLKRNPKFKEDYEGFILESASLIFDDLLKKSKESDADVDSVGLWITYEDGSIIENSIDLLVLKDMEQYGIEKINPIQEFFKMTVNI